MSYNPTVLGLSQTVQTLTEAIRAMSAGQPLSQLQANALADVASRLEAAANLADFIDEYPGASRDDLNVVLTAVSMWKIQDHLVTIEGQLATILSSLNTTKTNVANMYDHIRYTDEINTFPDALYFRNHEGTGPVAIAANTAILQTADAAGFDPVDMVWSKGCIYKVSIPYLEGVSATAGRNFDVGIFIRKADGTKGALINRESINNRTGSVTETRSGMGETVVWIASDDDFAGFIYAVVCTAGDSWDFQLRIAQYKFDGSQPY